MYHCSYGLTGQVILPSDFDYAEARQGYNRAIQQYPLIINYCFNKFDVRNAINWSLQNGVPIRVRNGGHNYEGYSNGDCTLVIDVSNMNHMQLDEEGGRLTVEGGVTNGQVYEFLAPTGYPFPGGTCPTVGLGGYASGGGWGMSCRYFGLGCDSLEEIELVNAKGCFIKANSCCNADLFWACRGAGGGNFGVIVSMKFKLPPKVEQVTLIQIEYPNGSALEQASFLSLWQSWLAEADQRITLLSRLYNSAQNGTGILARGIFYGQPDEAEPLLQPLLSLPGVQYTLEAMSFFEAVSQVGSTYPPFEKFQAVSRFVLRNLREREISNVVSLLTPRPQGSVFTGLSLYALGGRVQAIKKNETAFFYRSARYIIWLETTWEENRYAKINRNWIKQQFPTFAAATTGSYVNFPYSGLPCYLEEYYGSHVTALKAIKEKYDPCNRFCFPQGMSRC